MTKGPNTRLVYGVRFHDGEFQLRCEACKVSNQHSYYWPITLDFWEPDKGFSRCRACWATYHRLRMAHRRATDPGHLRARRQKYYREAREAILLKKKDRYWENRDTILAHRREMYRLKKAAQRLDGAA